MIEEKSAAHVVLAALTAAGFDLVMTGYDPERMSLVASDGEGRSFDLALTLRLGKPEPIGTRIKFVSQAAE